MEGLEGTHTVDLLEEIILEEALAAVDAGEDTEIRDYGKNKGFQIKIFLVCRNRKCERKPEISILICNMISKSIYRD